MTKYTCCKNFITKDHDQTTTQWSLCSSWAMTNSYETSPESLVQFADYQFIVEM